MRKNFSKKTVLLPLPVYIIGTYDENGKANAMNLAWGVQCGYHEVSLSIAREHKTMKNILLKKAFTISLATKATKDIADYFGIVSGNKVDKIEKSGVHIVKSENIDAPIIEEFPLTLECKVIDIQEELGDYRVVAEIINTLADERVLNKKGEIDVDKLELITFDSLTNSYRILGEKVGQAFKDNRLFRILYYILEKEKVTANELADKFEVSVRTIYRDIDSISSVGVPIFTTQGKGGGIKIDNEFILNKSLFDTNEKEQIIAALQGLEKTNEPYKSELITKLSALFKIKNSNWIEIDFTSWGSNNAYQDLFFQNCNYK